jgi:hypothetical protein
MKETNAGIAGEDSTLHVEYMKDSITKCMSVALRVGRLKKVQSILWLVNYLLRKNIHKCSPL